MNKTGRLGTFGIVLSVVFLGWACDQESPTAPRTEAETGRLTAGARAPTELLGHCPPGFDVINVKSPYFNPAIDNNGDGIICARLVGPEDLRVSRIRLVDNRVQGRLPSSARLTLALEQDL